MSRPAPRGVLFDVESTLADTLGDAVPDASPLAIGAGLHRGVSQ
jgi:hypothetical protein